MQNAQRGTFGNIKLPFVIKIFVLSIFEWPFYTGFTVCGRASYKPHAVVFIPHHTLVSGYYVIPFGVCPSVGPSVRPCSPFPIDNLSIDSWNFFKFCIHIVIGNEWYGIVNGQNLSIFNGVTALFRIDKLVSGLLFLYCS